MANMRPIKSVDVEAFQTTSFRCPQLKQKAANREKKRSSGNILNNKKKATAEKIRNKIYHRKLIQLSVTRNKGCRTSVQMSNTTGIKCRDAYRMEESINIHPRNIQKS